MSTSTHAAAPIDAKQASKLFPAIAKIQLQKDSTIKLLAYCGSQFAGLKDRSTRISKRWLTRNHAILHKAETIHERLWQSLKQQSSGLKAETFSLDIDKLVSHYVQRQLQSMKAYSPQQQRILCEHLIVSVNSGAWDISRKQLRAYTVLENFH